MTKARLNYKPYLNPSDGMYYVGKGKAYFTDQSFDSERECMRRCIIQQMQDYYWACEDMWERLCDKYPSDYDRWEDNKGDYFC